MPPKTPGPKAKRPEAKRAKAKRQSRGLRAVAEAVQDVTGNLNRRNGFAEPALVRAWTEIVGPDLATQCAPLRLVAGPHGKGGTLHIRVSGPLALELQHLQPQVLQRVNGYFGYRAVDRLALRQAPMASLPGTPPRRRMPAPRSLPEAERAALDAQLATVTDPDLRAALARLGRHVLSNPRRGGSP